MESNMQQTQGLPDNAARELKPGETYDQIGRAHV